MFVLTMSECVILSNRKRVSIVSECTCSNRWEKNVERKIERNYKKLEKSIIWKWEIILLRGVRFLRVTFSSKFTNTIYWIIVYS